MFPPWAAGARFALLLGVLVSRGQEASAVAPYRIASPLIALGVPETFVGFDRYFAMHIPVIEPACEACLGVHVFATEAVSSAKAERVAKVLAQYLDNDGDGLADNPRVAEEMDKKGALMVVFGDPLELIEANFSCDGYHCQDEWDNETGSPLSDDSDAAVQAQVVLDGVVGRADGHLRCVHNRSVICDAVLEEAFHLLTDVGYAGAYPKILGTQAGSALSLAMTESVGNCGYNTPETPLGKYARFAYPNCTGTYHYWDPTCSFSCLATEYLHHLVASYNGEYAWGRADLGIPNTSLCNREDGRAQEWENCVTGPGQLERSRERLRRGAPEGLSLLLDPDFKFPLVMPTGDYSPPAPAKGGPETTRHLRGRQTHRQLRIQDVRFVLGRSRA